MYIEVFRETTRGLPETRLLKLNGQRVTCISDDPRMVHDLRRLAYCDAKESMMAISSGWNPVRCDTPKIVIVAQETYIVLDIH